MAAGVSLTKIIRIGTTHYLLLPAPLRSRLTWREGDAVAVREAGDKLILERVAAEKLCILRSGTSNL